jgi:hypothetical protein
MKKLVLILFVLFLVTACEKEETDINQTSALDLNELKSGKAKKIYVCHYSSEDDSWHLIYISENAWAAHEQHGDIRLDDQDGDGFVPYNECGYGNMGDTDDHNSCINPDNTSTITAIRLGGEPGDAYIGPTCNSDGTYRTCFYLTGIDLPSDDEKYHVQLNGTEYPIAFHVVLSPTEMVICVTNIPAGETGIDVFVELEECVYIEKKDFFDAPKCGEITGIRLGGQTGDAYIGPTCSTDGTYRTCFYVTGTDLPDLNPDYKIIINEVEYPIAFNVHLNSNEVVICATGLPSGEIGVDVFIQLRANLSYEAEDLYDAPSCKAEITEFRLGGEPGDSYIGPTCNSDGTYRTTFYISGNLLPVNQSDYIIKINAVEYPIVFFTTLSPNQVVVGLTGLPSGESGVDVSVMLPSEVVYDYIDFYDAPNCPVMSSTMLMSSQISFIAE